MNQAPEEVQAEHHRAQNAEKDVKNDHGGQQEQRLKGMKTDKLVAIVRLDEQENEADDRDVAERGGNIVR